MTKEEIISQGWLEAYITGDLSGNETKIVEDFIKESKEVRDEYKALQKTLAELAFAQAIKPSAKVKKSLMSELSPDVKNKQNSILSYAAVASIVFAISMGLTAYSFWTRWQEVENKYKTLLSENQTMAATLKKASEDYELLEENNEIATSANYKRIILKGTDNAPDLQAVVFWNPEEEAVYLNASTFETLNEAQQYQLWALIDGKPVDAGVFDPESKLIAMKSIGQADAFAVTIEKKGGSEQPDLSALQVIGETS
ncbi:anti-sigma factor [Chondrinema litorale]|uniref:anti-sigma factor n=1 Tax=Chondrinema litorale TaxID=2994555 RepID=UPI002543881B|nr:anti-sigma factor [Chondrinema litorale]UZR99371.1 anti-sigma factor [Chondrinema litorale]